MSVCLFVSNKQQTAKPIGPQFCVGPHITPGKVYGCTTLQKMYVQKFLIHITERGTFIQWEGYRALSYNSAMTANGKHFFKSSTISGRTKRSKIKRACRCGDGERRKEDWNMQRTILFYKNYEKINSKTFKKNFFPEYMYICFSL